MEESILERASLFSPAEREAYASKERSLVAMATRENIQPLLDFWAEKRKLFMWRAEERRHGVVDVPTESKG